jgi:hypothetical protein
MAEYIGMATSDISVEELMRGKKAMEWLWNALKKVNNQYDSEEFETVFEEATLGDLVSVWDLDDFISKFKEHELEREKIRVGDEIRWTQPHIVYEKPMKSKTTYIRRAGIVLSVEPATYVVLVYNSDYAGFFKLRLRRGDETIEKTYVHFDIDSVEK